MFTIHYLTLSFTNRLNVSEMKDLLLKLDTLVEIQNGNLTAKFQE